MREKKLSHWSCTKMKLSLNFVLQVWRIDFMEHNSYREKADLLLRVLQEATDSVHAGVPKPIYLR